MFCRSVTVEYLRHVCLVLKSLYFALPFLALLLFAVGDDSFAAKTQIIKIPSGASDPNASYFWSEQGTGVTTGEITVHPSDTIRWENADTAFHTITSVTRTGEVDGLFDSGFFTAGKSYSRQFDDLGDFFYFCSIHPWMNGVVHVVKDTGNVQSIKNVGSGLSQTGMGFEVKYILDQRLDSSVKIDSSANTLTFKILGDTQSEQITLILPTDLIQNPNSVWIDGNMAEFTSEDTQAGKKLNISLPVNSKEIKIMGTHVIPEFGLFALGILSIGIIGTLIVRNKLLKPSFYSH